MTSKVVSGNGFSQYILTLTLYEHLCSFKRVGLKIPDRVMIDKIEAGLTELMKKAFNGTKNIIEVIRFADFCDDIISAGRELKVKMPDAIIISTTPMIACDTGGICIGLSRLIDFDGNIIGVGSRAGNFSFERQIELISRELSGRSVIILEDGSFSGDTLDFIIGKLSQKKAKVEAVVMGILFPKAKKKLASVFKGQLICKYHFENPFDWMPSHDFFPFIPNAGRVVGTKVGDSLIPVHLFDRATLSKPYILPYGNLNDWAGLPLTPQAGLDFSQFCMTSVVEIFQEMEKLNGRIITIGDLIDTRPVTSVPVISGRREIDAFSLTNRVIDVLNNDCAWINEAS